MPTPPKAYLTPEEYLEIERKAEFKSEYLSARTCAVGGAGRAHSLVIANLAREVGNQIRSSPGEAYPAHMRVLIPSNGMYIYPDFVVVCGKPEFLDEREDILLNPMLIVEVLSPSTEAYDRGDKFELYRSVKSLREYVLIASGQVLVERFARRSENQWLLGSADKLEAAIKLESADLELRLADLYEKIEFSLAPPQMRRLHF